MSKRGSIKFTASDNESLTEFNKPDVCQPTILHRQSPIKPLKSQRNNQVANNAKTNRKNCEIVYNSNVNADKRRLFTHFSLETEVGSSCGKQSGAPAMLRLPKIESNYNSTNQSKINAKNNNDNESGYVPSHRFSSFQDKPQGFLSKLKDNAAASKKVMTTANSSIKDRVIASGKKSSTNAMK